jgi:hypothetical protein
MNAIKTRWCWRKDLREFRGLSDSDRNGFLLALEWFENFRLRHELEAGARRQGSSGKTKSGGKIVHANPGNWSSGKQRFSGI